MGVMSSARWAVLIALLPLLGPGTGFSKAYDPNEVRKLVQDFKKDDRGPFQAIRWFCPDGTVLPPDKRCPERGGIQHALHKDKVQVLAREQGIYLGQILAGTPFEDFLEGGNRNSRAKQYQVEKYLQTVDDGWILRKARYYRGAIQAEDEEKWGRGFLKWLAGRDTAVTSQFFLLRELARDVPHRAEDDRWRVIRARSMAIAEAFPAFSALRVKLHSQPEAGDVEKVKAFRAANRDRMPAEIAEMIDALIGELELAYRPSHLLSLLVYLKRLPQKSAVRTLLASALERYAGERTETVPGAAGTAPRMRAFVELLWEIRKEVLAEPDPGVRLTLLDLSNDLGNLFFLECGSWRPATVGELLDKAWALAQASAACGFLENWEWEELRASLGAPPGPEGLTLETLVGGLQGYRRAVEWGTGMVRAIYGPTVSLFSGFDPLAHGFLDDRIRSSPLLRLGEVVGELSEFVARRAGTANRVMGIANQNRIRGLNPGFALGRLNVLGDRAAPKDFSNHEIYVLMQAPSDLKPVAGIATVSEGNLVSHVQLLARNLGIPNAVVSEGNLNDLQAFDGQEVFYAVSPKGTVLMKAAAEMTAQEKTLVEERRRREERISVPEEKIDLAPADPLSLKSLQASDSGRICGPKAANLGQLKRLFPARVVEGLVLPFGVFRRHFDQAMRDSAITYWQFLEETFRRAAGMRAGGSDETEIEAAVLERLAALREAVGRMPLLPAFQRTLEAAFQAEFGRDLGELPVFIRSDTNMEDLKDFTGAGLNLTVFNVAARDSVYQAIRDVWASPFTERSYRWRQRFLLNPENVYPSILILPSVDVDKSGVMITMDVTTSDPAGTTVAFSRGAGGAVEGQTAETYLIAEGAPPKLLSPSRETTYTALPPEGGIRKRETYLDKPVLSRDELDHLSEVAAEIRVRLPGTPGIETAGPFDVELGLKDGHVWLFQVRPYVENKKARSSLYLRSLDPEIPEGTSITPGDRLPEDR